MEFSSKFDKDIEDIELKIRDLQKKKSDVSRSIIKEKRDFLKSLVCCQGWSIYEYHTQSTGRWEFDDIHKYYLVSPEFMNNNHHEVNQIELNPVETWIEFDSHEKFMIVREKKQRR